MSRGLQRSAVALTTAAIAAVSIAAQGVQGNQGILFSEVVHGPTFGGGMPSYIELVNVRIANPTIPPPVQMGGAVISASVNNQPPVVFMIPGPVLLGGNVQPPPATQPPVTPANPPVMLIASAGFPAGTLPPGAIVILAPALFSGTNGPLGAPGVPFELCLNVPSTGHQDRLVVGATASNCPSVPFAPTATFSPTTGKAIRWTYMDSNTDIDFDSAFGISPGVVNPQMTHVNGFYFGVPGASPISGAPLGTTGSPTSGSLSFPPNGMVTGIHFMNSFLDRTITNPSFDAVVNANVTMNAAFTAQPAAISQPGFLPGLQILNETMTITVLTPQGSGTLDMPMGLSQQVGSNIGPSAVQGEIRPERIFTDSISDAAPFIGGQVTGAMIDVIPPSTGGGNTWCEIIVYDYQGNQYRAKVKNWPPGGACSGPILGLGTDGAGSCTLIDLCFHPGSMIANIFSTASVTGCGGPLLPPGGICPDATTSWIFTPPQLGAAPFFVNADAAGIYIHYVPTGTLIALIGITVEGVAVEYAAGGTIVQQSGVNSVMF